MRGIGSQGCRAHRVPLAGGAVARLLQKGNMMSKVFAMLGLAMLLGLTKVTAFAHAKRTDNPNGPNQPNGQNGQNSTDFGRMFPDLPAFHLEDEQPLKDLALAMKDPNAAVNDNPNGTPSGFTYLGQFLDHDLTLDATPLGDANIDIDAMVNGRTAK